MLPKMLATKETGVLRSKVVRARIRRTNSLENRSALMRPHWADIWLPRLSHLAQFGLFVFTLGFSYFTVLPLYQKSVLEEAVAKRELELGNLNKSLEMSYAKLRVYAMRQFYIEAMPACGGLFIERGRKEDDGAKMTRAEMVFQIDIPHCLKNLANEVEALKDLTLTDRQTFDATLNRISQEISVSRQQAINAHELASSKVTDDDWDTLPSDSFRVQAQNQIEKWRGGVPDLAARRKIAEAIAKERVGTAYEDLIRERVSSLRTIRWDTSH